MQYAADIAQLERELAEEARLVTVPQLEGMHPGLRGRTRWWITCADRGDPRYAALREAIVRVGRSVLINERKFISALIAEHSAQSPAPARNPDGRAGKPKRARNVTRTGDPQ